MACVNEWYYAKNGTQHGPVTLETLRGLASSGGLSGEDLVWNQTMKDWLPATQVAGVIPTQAIDPANPYAVSQTAFVPPSMIPVFDEPALAEIEPGSEKLAVMKCTGRGFTLTARHFGTLILAMLIFMGIQWAIGMPLGIVEGIIKMNSGYRPPTPPSVGAGSAEMLEFMKTSMVSEMLSPIRILNQIITTLAALFLTAGVYRVCLNVVSGKQVGLGQMFGVGPLFLKIVGAYLLYMLLLLVVSLPSLVPWYFFATKQILPHLSGGFDEKEFFSRLDWQAVGMAVATSFVLSLPVFYLMGRLCLYQIAIVDRSVGVVESLHYSWKITRGSGWRFVGLMIMMFLVTIAGMLVLCVGILFAVPMTWVMHVAAYRWLQYGRRALEDHPGTTRPVLSTTP